MEIELPEAEVKQEVVGIPHERYMRITVSNSASIPTGIQYEQQKPFYSLSHDLPIYPGEDLERLAQAQIGWMKGIIDSHLKQDFELIYNCRSREQALANHRISVVDGVKYPHVSEIITPFKPPIPFIEQHAYLGTLLDGVLKDYVDHKEMIYPEEVKETPDIKVTFDDLFQRLSEWIEANGSRMEFLRHSVSIVNTELLFTGELDVLGSLDKTICIFDCKKTENLKPMLEKYFMQMAAYAKSIPEKVELLCIISPFNPPVVTAEIDKYWNKFLVARGEYKNRFGV